MSDLIKVSLLGTLPGGEVWSVNPVFKITTGGVIGQAEANAIVTAVNGLTIGLGLKTLMSSDTRITGCRVEARTADGGLDTLAEGARGTPVAGNGAGALPFQSSLVMSLRTNVPGGRGRGRLYWPATGCPIDGVTLRVSSSNMSTISTDLKAFMVAIEAAVDTAVDETVALGVWSRTSQTVATVNQVRFGNIIDTQRRRRDSLAESYSIISYP